MTRARANDLVAALSPEHERCTMTELTSQHVRVIEGILDALEIRLRQAQEEGDVDRVAYLRQQIAAREEELAALLEEELGS